MNIYELLKIIRDNDGAKGEFTQVAEVIMSMYTCRLITCETVLVMYAAITNHMILSSSPYAHTAKHQQLSQGV